MQCPDPPGALEKADDDRGWELAMGDWWYGRLHLEIRVADFGLGHLFMLGTVPSEPLESDCPCLQDVIELQVKDLSTILDKFGLTAEELLTKGIALEYRKETVDELPDHHTPDDPHALGT